MPDWKASSFASRQLGHLYYIRPFDLDPSRKNGGEGFLCNEDTLCVARFIWLNGLDEFNGHRIWKCPFTNTLVHSLFLLGKMNELLVNGGGGCMLSIRTERIYTTWSWSVLRTIELWRVPRLNAFYTIYIYIYKLFFGIVYLLDNHERRFSNSFPIVEIQQRFDSESIVAGYSPSLKKEPLLFPHTIP